MTSSAQLLTPSQESYHKHVASCFPHQIPTVLPCNTCSTAQHPTHAAWMSTNQGKHRGPHKGSQCCHIPCVPPAACNGAEVISQVENGSKIGRKAAGNAFGKTCTDVGICAARRCGLSRGQPACLFTGLVNYYRKCHTEHPRPFSRATKHQAPGTSGHAGIITSLCALVLPSYLCNLYAILKADLT